MAGTRRGWRPQIMHKLLALGLGGVITTAAALVAVGAWRSGDFSDRTAAEVSRMNAAELQRITRDVTRLVSSVGDQVQAGVNGNMAAAGAILRQRGGLQLQERTATWTATNQFTQQKRTVTLPRMAVRGEWLRQNADRTAPTPLVDDLKAVLGGTVTVFQRMNDAGDLLRVATNVPSRTGGRAIGTYIPAVGADGTPNAVASAIREGRSYRGVALVVDTWYISAYDPVKDASGRVIGALYYGVPQAEALANLTAAIADTGVRENGWVTVYSTAEADAGRVIASSIEGAAGATASDTADADGRRYVEEVVAAAPKLTGGDTFRSTYRLPGAAGAPAADTVVTAAYYPPYRWAIAVGGYEPDTAGALNAVRDGRRTMLLWFVVAALLLAVLGAVVALAQSRRISRRLGSLTTALSRLAGRDLTVRVPVSGDDEIGRAGIALNTAAAELRGVLTDVTGASAEVQQSAGRVAANGALLADAAEAASGQAGTASSAAGDISSHVQTVAAGAEEMGASIGEISSNAQEAAQAGRDGVQLARQASGVVAELRRSTTQISDVVRLIAGIAEQTNLLALNATIEAARAGDLGKGFAVVAGEVKELAQETARATDDVTGRVAAIEADTARAVEAIDAITATIGRVDSYQTAIAAAVEEQAATTAEMARTINEVATGSGDIAHSITAVSAAADTTHQAVDVSRRAAEELNATAGRLTGLVGRFTV